MKRRAFLQQTGIVLTALGLSEADLSLLSNRYGQALAQSTPRKLALLVGINQYRGATLNGCVTDVELQRELLIHRFGFRASDILTLTEQQATRQNLEAAFMSHLVEQARPGDVVVFHYSGYGHSARLSDRPDEAQLCLVPVDVSWNCGSNCPPGEAIHPLPAATLLLLLRSLATDQITTVLDTSFQQASPAALVYPSLKLRALPLEPEGISVLEDSELSFQEQLLSQLHASKNQLWVEWQSGQLPGIVLAAAELATQAGGTTLRPAKNAFERQWPGFSAGLFTYALTQHLWWKTASPILQVSLGRTQETIEQWVGTSQQPALTGLKSQKSASLNDALTPHSEEGADGVFLSVDEDGKGGRVWLGGLPLPVLDYYGNSSLLMARSSAPTPDQPPLEKLFQITARDGLSARVRLVGRSLEAGEAMTVPLTIGQKVQERLRVLPRSIPLNVALDPGLERIERVDATSAFSGISFAKLISTPDLPADCILGRSPEANAGYSLFALGREVLPGTAGPAGETVKAAIQRLMTPLRALLAAKLLRLTVNESTAQLGVSAALEVLTPQRQVVIQRQTLEAKQDATTEAAPAPGMLSQVTPIAVGSRIRYQVHNHSTHPLYLMVLGLDTGGNAIVFSPGQVPAAPEAESFTGQLLIPAGETVFLPRAASSFEWLVREPERLAETYLVFNVQPFTQTLAVLDVNRLANRNERILVPSNPLELVQALFSDLHQSSQAGATYLPSTTDSFMLDMQSWVTLCFVYRVI